MAATLRAPWVAVYVETVDSARMSKEDAERIAQTLHLAEELGAETATLSAARIWSTSCSTMRDGAMSQRSSLASRNNRAAANGCAGRSSTS